MRKTLKCARLRKNLKYSQTHTNGMKIREVVWGGPLRKIFFLNVFFIIIICSRLKINYILFRTTYPNINIGVYNSVKILLF